MKRTLIVLLFILHPSSLILQAAQRPNVIYIMSDDHAAHAISAYHVTASGDAPREPRQSRGNVARTRERDARGGSRLASIAPTPNIDRLANEGMLFENAFCTNSICSPSRACVLTGQYAHTNGAYDLGGRVPPGKQMLAIEFGKAGYETAMIGKWHLKDEPADFNYYCVLPGQGKYHDPEFRIRGDKPWGKNLVKKDGMHSSDAITDITLDWLDKKRDKSAPFFLMHHYKAPHDYFDNAPRYEDYLRDVDIPEPASLWTDHKPGSKFGSLATRGANDELVPHIGTSIGDRNPRRSYSKDLPKLYPAEYPENYDPANHSADEIKRFAYNAYLKKFLRCVKGIDDNLGRLFAYLEANDLMDNTVIIYTGDQGFMLGEHDYQDKRWMYEESQRMPFLIRYPGKIKPGQRTDAIIENVDYGPTMLDFAGIEIPSSVQGRSFKSICETGTEPDGWKQAAYYRYWMHMAHHDNPGHVGLRTKTHKLIFYYGVNYKGEYPTPPAWELYNLENDPHETVNEYDNPEYAPIVAKLKQQLADLRTNVGDTGEDYPEVEKVIQEFWDYSEADRAKAEQISHDFLATRKKELARRARK